MSQHFEIDVLILYADRDNVTTSSVESGWVSQFKRFLELMLTQVLGEKPNVMLKSEHDPITSPNLDNAAILITVLSQEFIGSKSCIEHLERFMNSAKESNKSPRVFKVFKNQIPLTLQPKSIKEQLGYDMYQLDPDSGEVKEYTDYFTTEAERQYWMKMVDLAYDIFDTLTILEGKGQISEMRSDFKRKTIYVAHCGHDLSVQRNIIKRELQRHGYKVLPNHTLNDQISDLENEIRSDLDRSDLSIHLIGATYGEIPQGSNHSIVDIQNRLAAEKSIQAKEQNRLFTRLIWISPNLTNSSEKQRDFIENLKRDVESQEGAEILQTPLEDFKSIMREELLETSDNRFSDLPEGQSVYLVYDKVDSQEANSVIQAIKEAGFQVLQPKFQGELLELRKVHINNLKNFDAAIIFKGKVNEQWVKMKVLDLLKAPGFGRQKPIIGKAILTGEEFEFTKQTFKDQDLRIIARDSSFESLKSFLQEFKN